VVMNDNHAPYLLDCKLALLPILHCLKVHIRLELSSFIGDQCGR
jgi:hypothetical protein